MTTIGVAKDKPGPFMEGSQHKHGTNAVQGSLNACIKSQAIQVRLNKQNIHL
jgi:hypothetical protein